MKAVLYDVKGKKKTDIELPEMFNEKVREDIVAKYFEADKFIQPYSNDPKAGRKHSASGKISHRRHRWGGHYGRGVSRVPRKTMWRRGVHFFWVGAEIPSARGGRRAHGPKGVGKEKKINKKEIQKAFNSAFAATTDASWVVKRYGTVEKVDLKMPVVVESKLDGAKTKDVLEMLKNIFGDVFPLVVKKKSVRAGKGASRGRKYKSNAGAILIKGQDERIKMKGIDIKNSGDVTISDLYPLGRLAIYTQKAIEELGGKK